MNLKNLSQLKVNHFASNLNQCLVIHYSCESFIDKPEGYSPRISSLAIKHLTNEQIKSFSIHKYADIERIPRSEIEGHYDFLEKRMLDEFFSFLKENQSCYFIHWSMNDINYGFEAIYHRYSVLGGKPIKLDDVNLLPLTSILIRLYGPDYAPHERLENLLDINKISKHGFQKGKDEAKAFENKEFQKLHLSTIRKVEAIGTIFTKLVEGKLKVQTPKVILQINELREHTFYKVTEIVLAAFGLIAIIEKVSIFF